MGDIDDYVNNIIPKAVTDLAAAEGSIKQIATYCKASYPSDPAKVYEQTMGYTKDVLLNVAYHIQTISTHITSVLDLQIDEVERLDSGIRVCLDRARLAHKAVGCFQLNNEEAAAKDRVTAYKVAKLDAGAVDGQAIQPLQRYTRAALILPSADDEPPPTRSDPVLAMPAPTQANRRLSTAPMNAPTIVTSPPPSASAGPPPTTVKKAPAPLARPASMGLSAPVNPPSSSAQGRPAPPPVNAKGPSVGANPPLTRQVSTTSKPPPTTAKVAVGKPAGAPPPGGKQPASRGPAPAIRPGASVPRTQPQPAPPPPPADFDLPPPPPPAGDFDLPPPPPVFDMPPPPPPDDLPPPPPPF